jgi:hypothetical protein
MSDSSKPLPPPGFPRSGSPSFGEPAADQPSPTAVTRELADPFQPVDDVPVDDVPVYDRGTAGGGRRPVVLAAVVALLVGLGGGFLAGRQTAPKGPATLADAVRLAGQGKLPTGTFTPGQGGFGGLFRGGNGQGAPFGGGQNGQNGNGQGSRGAPGRQFNRSIQATVSSVAGDVVTVQTAAGQVQVRIGPGTRIEKAARGSKTDLAPGSRVLVTLDVASSAGNGSVTAASILAEGAAS